MLPNKPKGIWMESNGMNEGMRSTETMHRTIDRTLSADGSRKTEANPKLKTRVRTIDFIDGRWGGDGTKSRAASGGMRFRCAPVKFTADSSS